MLDLCLARQTALNPKNMPVATLPPLAELIYMDKSEREITEARILAQLKRLKQQNIEAAISLPDPVEWIESHCYATLNGKLQLVRLTSVQKRIIRKVLTINPHTGRFPYRTVVYSAPKKSGKSAVGGFIAAYFAANVEAPNEIYILANDREQSSGRVYKSALPTLTALGARKDGKYKQVLPNGTEVTAVTSDPDKEAGGSYGLTVWDELWAYKSERARLLFDELMPVATRKNSMRLIVTYAGFENSSDLLLSIYFLIFRNTKETELNSNARIVDELRDIVTTDGEGNEIPCCYENPKASLFYFNDHEKRMPWQTDEGGTAHESETEEFLTEASKYRLGENRWQLSESRFLEPEILEASRNKNLIVGRRMTFGIDASQRHDCTALAGTYEKDNRYCTGYAKAWYPMGVDIDLDATVAAEVVRLWRAGLIHRREPESGEKGIVETEGLTPVDVWYDPTQMHAVAMRLRKKHKILLREFNQVKERLLADTFLLQQYNDGNIDNIDDADLFSHLQAASAKDESKGDTQLVRIVKGEGKHAKPIDLAVAQSMSVWRASKRPRRRFASGIAQGKAKGWEKRNGTKGIR